MKHKITDWTITIVVERPDGTWFTDTITQIDNETSTAVDNFLTEYCEDKEKENDNI